MSTAAARPARHRTIGYRFVHSAVDEHSRLAYSEIHDDEQGLTAAGFWRRALTFFAGHAIALRGLRRTTARAIDLRTG